MVVDVIQDPLDFIYRFWGTSYTRIHNQEMTKKSVRELRSPGAAENSFAQYKEIVESTQPGFFSYPIQLTDRHHPVDRPSLRMPFSDDGRTVNIAVTFADWREDVWHLRMEHMEFFGESRFF